MQFFLKFLLTNDELYGIINISNEREKGKFKMEIKIARMKKDWGIGKIIAVFYDEVEAKSYVKTMNMINGTEYEYFIW